MARSRVLFSRGISPLSRYSWSFCLQQPNKSIDNWDRLWWTLCFRQLITEPQSFCMLCSQSRTGHSFSTLCYQFPAQDCAFTHSSYCQTSLTRPSRPSVLRSRFSTPTFWIWTLGQLRQGLRTARTTRTGRIDNIKLAARALIHEHYGTKLRHGLSGDSSSEWLCEPWR